MFRTFNEIKSILLVLKTLFFSGLMFSQYEYKPGYFIDNLGNKKECYIKYNTPYDNPSSFEYKLNLEDKTTSVINLNNSSLVVVNEEAKYIKATVMMDRHSDKINNLEVGKQIVLNKETHFLKFVVEGTCNLYVYNENGLEKFFYSTSKSSNIYQLNFKEFYIQNGELNTDKNEEYKRQLWDSIKCGLPDRKVIEALKYRENSLADYFVKINECQTGIRSVQNLKKVSKGSLDFKISVFNNFLKLTNSDKVIDFGNKNSLCVTGQIEYVFPFFKNKLSFFVEPVYYKFDQSLPFVNDQQFIGYDNSNIVVSENVFQLPFGLTYKFLNKKDFNFFLSASRSLYTKVSGDYYYYDVKPQLLYKISSPIPQTTIQVGALYKGFEVVFGWHINSTEPSREGFQFSRTSIGLRYRIYSLKNKN